MQLAAFMSDRGLDDEQMAELVRETSGLSCDRSTISRIRRGKCRPSWDLAACFKKISRGRILADDFLEFREARA